MLSDDELMSMELMSVLVAIDMALAVVEVAIIIADVAEELIDIPSIVLCCVVMLDDTI